MMGGRSDQPQIGLRGSKIEAGKKWRDGGLEAGKEQMLWDARVRTGRTRGGGHRVGCWDVSFQRWNSSE